MNFERQLKNLKKDRKERIVALNQLFAAHRYLSEALSKEISKKLKIKTKNWFYWMVFFLWTCKEPSNAKKNKKNPKERKIFTYSWKCWRSKNWIRIKDLKK